VQFRFDLLEKPENPKQKREMTLEELAPIVLQKSAEYASRNEGRVFTMIEFIFKRSASGFKQLMEEQGQFFDHILVLSGTILEPRRREIINFLKRNAHAKLKILLISTQVVEAGVDIDMDLGFKNISLIDSDEQLAGRINRNVNKATCEVYLFFVNKDSLLYGKDLRHKVTLENLSIEDHKKILETKDFKLLYDLVLEKINAQNTIPEGFENLHSYLSKMQQLDFKHVDEKFKLIDSNNVSIYVPMELPIVVDGAKVGEAEAIFSEQDLAFLAENKAYEAGESVVCGQKVWTLYRTYLRNRKDMEFFKKRVEGKKLQGILAKFTFSIFNSEKLIQKLTKHLDMAISLDEYLVLLQEHSHIYEYETGLKEENLDDADARIF
jgi:CRISPR-associated endonuclease/helicase Cas3